VFRRVFFRSLIVRVALCESAAVRGGKVGVYGSNDLTKGFWFSVMT
jgi:hypothetical protein